MTNNLANPASPSEQSMLAEARAEVAQADHKASLVLTVLGIGFGAILGGILAGSWKPDQYAAPGEFIWWLGAGAALASVLCSALAVWPRFSSHDTSAGIFYWGHVATFDDLPDFVAALDAAPPADVDRTRHQLYRLSRIVRDKYRLVRWAMGLACAAGILFALAALTGQ
ncbi:DUF5706 domain-containing protein [Rhodococcus qingshengii]|uniref:DUF5706 domain-containing protein n=1 Tax=Rhodococcus qingshengii TaxID=334542 RepID=A0AAW6LK92_RHOSG|nr:Pycsar system effector family protein [Rhodococcus qingshengii]MDE8647613.1 DUF5706 domain-containing protein [Rhodococcus qingshengii]